MDTDREVTGPAPASPASRSRVRRLRDRAAQMGDQAESWAEAARQRMPAVDLGLTLAGRIRLVQLSLVSGYLALRFFILLFPLAYVVIAGFGLAATRQETLDAGEEVGISAAVASSIADATATSNRGHWIALVVGLMATAWAGRSTLHALRIAHAEAWRIPVPKTKYASMGGLPVAVFVLAVVAFSSWISGQRHDGTHPGLIFVVQALVIAVLWLGVARFMPRAQGSGWQDLVPGALLVGLAAPALHLAVSLYFAPRVARTQATYGALGVGVVLLTYLLVISWLISLSAELNGGLFAWRRSRHGG